MGWENIDLQNINPNFELIPAGRYTFRLLGGGDSTKFPGAVEARATIESDGEFQGRRVFLRYSDPDVYTLSPKAFKKLEMSLGVDILAGETPVEYLTRAAAQGARFSAEVYHHTYDDKNSGEKNTVADVRLFSVGPAA